MFEIAISLFPLLSVICGLVSLVAVVRFLKKLHFESKANHDDET
jgi:hypothetical protein